MSSSRYGRQLVAADRSIGPNASLRAPARDTLHDTKHPNKIPVTYFTSTRSHCLVSASFVDILSMSVDVQ
jgi:hypothetical protein